MSIQTPSSQLPGVEHVFWRNQRTFGVFQGLNGGLDLGISTQVNITPGANQYTGNFNGQWVNVQAPNVANTQFQVNHNLGRIPSFYWFISDIACDLYQLPNTGTAWTQTAVFLKCNAASANLRIFLL